jgi:hypothetical protein
MRIVPAKNGARWLAYGFSLYRRSPAAWLMLVLGYWLIVAVLGLVPVVGAAASTVLLPAFTMSFMYMCTVLEKGAPLRPAFLLAGFRTRGRVLVMLGVLYLVSITLVLAVASLADQGALLEWVMVGQEPTPEMLREGLVSRALLVASLAAAPVLMAFWFAPPLAAWEGMNAAQSLFYSFFAAWRNWRAFLVYGAWLMLLGLAFLFALAVAAALSGGRPEFLRAVMLGFTLLTLPTLFGSFYASYRDVFPDAKLPEEPAP